MERFTIEFSKKAAKEYQKLPSKYKALVDASLRSLSKGIPTDVKPLKGEKNVYRIRVGRYRILFKKIQETLLIAKIGPRGDVYKD